MKNPGCWHCEKTRSTGVEKIRLWPYWPYCRRPMERTGQLTEGMAKPLAGEKPESTRAEAMVT